MMSVTPFLSLASVLPLEAEFDANLVLLQQPAYEWVRAAMAISVSEV
jgi:hypothetical protein